ncbi:hypothetical protein BC835DRAFT_1519164 [Cytidiella melzeri]|nr:hypothetical protein BC835DRAFT_1519164 [Cytidiella melzeri]
MSTSTPSPSTPAPERDAGKPETVHAEPQGYISRLSRSASTMTSQGLSYFNSVRGGGTKQDDNSPAKSRPGTPKADGSSTNPTTSKEGSVAPNTTAFERFMNLGKTRKDWEIEWPPSHWAGDKDGKKDVVETVQPVDSSAAADPQNVPESGLPPAQADTTLDAATLAQRIQRLLNTYPSELPSSNTSAQPPVLADEAAGTPHPSDVSSRPPLVTPPSHPAIVSDPQLVSLLSSPEVMNGVAERKDKAGAGQSVWDALEHLKAQMPWPGRTQSTVGTSPYKPADKGKGNEASASIDKKEGEESDDEVDDDDSGFMVYGPLFPSTDPAAAASDVELAKSELVPVPEHHHGDHKDKYATPGETSKPTSTQAAAAAAKLELLRNKVENMWPFAKNASTEQPENPEQLEPTLSTTRVHFVPVSTQAKQKRIWVPSPDKISVQVMWWGYRIYLPPPVLEILDNKQLEGAKRAALLTTALKYALDRIPIALVPIQAQPALRLCKAFTPYLGYVGTFAAWSWSAIRGFDKGHGVTLSATWLLSIAVIPGAWEAEGIPGLEGRTEKKVDGGEAGDVKSKDGKEKGKGAGGKPPNR